MSETSGRKLLTINEACVEVKVSRRTLYNWLAAGKIEVTRTPSGRVRVFADSLFHSTGDGDAAAPRA